MANQRNRKKVSPPNGPPVDPELDANLGGDYARDDHRGGFGDDYARDAGPVVTEASDTANPRTAARS
jgi:hypothetical protein